MSEVTLHNSVGRLINSGLENPAVTCAHCGYKWTPLYAGNPEKIQCPLCKEYTYLNEDERHGMFVRVVKEWTMDEWEQEVGKKSPKALSVMTATFLVHAPLHWWLGMGQTTNRFVIQEIWAPLSVDEMSVPFSQEEMDKLNTHKFDPVAMQGRMPMGYFAYGLVTLSYLEIKHILDNIGGTYWWDCFRESMKGELSLYDLLID